MPFENQSYKYVRIRTGKEKDVQVGYKAGVLGAALLLLDILYYYYFMLNKFC